MLVFGVPGMNEGLPTIVPACSSSVVHELPPSVEYWIVAAASGDADNRYWSNFNVADP
jgi:hypothetical protein